MTVFDLTHQTICESVHRFEKGIKHYMSPSYQESEARQDFIDDFFTALGWDVRHREQQNPYEQEVKIEKSQRQLEAKAQKRADYAFYLAPNYTSRCIRMCNINVKELKLERYIEADEIEIIEKG